MIRNNYFFVLINVCLVEVTLNMVNLVEIFFENLCLFKKSVQNILRLKRLNPRKCFLILSAKMYDVKWPR